MMVEPRALRKDGFMKNKKVLMVLPHMVGGGAERVSAQIINEMNRRGIDTTFILTSDKKDEVVRSDLDENTELILLPEVMNPETTGEKLRYMPSRLISSLFSKFYEKSGKYVPAALARMSLQWQYHREIKYIRQVMTDSPDTVVIAFLQPAIPIVLLAGLGLKNRIILSERCDPNRLMKKRYGKKFIEKYYVNADVMVFQTEDAKKVYPDSVSKNGCVISNPIKAGLPKSYSGERNQTISTFCRISEQKNLPLLIDAFAMLHKEHPDYTLRIIGDAPNQEDKEVLQAVKAQIAELKLGDCVKLEPFMKNVHEAVMKDAMYVSSSDYEGISNAMLEAMAIGMPVVCTDCPIGGAKATIKDGENGLLVPIKDAKALYLGMKRLIEDKALAKKVSSNASLLREELSLASITEKWIQLLGD